MAARALARFRICDFSGQLAGAGATRFLAAFGAQVIRVEDPVRQGPTEAYDSCWIDDVKRIGAENYYPPFEP